MIDLLIFVIVVTVVAGAVIENIRLKNKNVELMFLLAQSTLDINAVKDKISNLKDNPEKDHFIAFLNDTRNMAYKYIEELQGELITFAKVLEKELESPNDLSVPRIAKAFEQVEKMRPREGE